MFPPAPFPGGIVALIASFAWLAIGGLSAVAVLFALVLAPIARTAVVAQVLSRIALWGGIVAVLLVVIASMLSSIDLKEDSRRYAQNLIESAVAVSFTILIPLAALAARFWSRRTLRSKASVTMPPTN